MKVNLEMDKEFKKLCETALSKWGSKAQILMMCEESAETIKALLKLDRKRNGSTVEDVVSELVDLEIMLGQMKYIFDVPKLWDSQKQLKLNRLQESLTGP